MHSAEVAAAESALRAQLDEAVQQRDELAQRLRSCNCSEAPASAREAHALEYEAAVARSERDTLRAQRDALLHEREELHAVLLSAFSHEAGPLEHIPALGARLAPLQAQLAAACTERDMLAAEREGLRAQLHALRTLQRNGA